MSGIEILGIVASVLQIADVGARLSVRLCTFSHTISHARSSLQDVSTDVALTCNVLRELGDNLKKDQLGRLCSRNAITAAEGVVNECLRVFIEVEGALEGSLGKMVGKGKVAAGVVERLKWPFLQPKMDLLRSNLERLKTTLLLILNVIIYARQLAENEHPSMIGEQRELIKNLQESKRAYDKKFETLSRAIEGLEMAKETSTPAATQESADIDTAIKPALKRQKKQAQALQTDHRGDTCRSPYGFAVELEHYCNLVRDLVEGIDAVQYAIAQERRLRMQEHVLLVHDKEKDILAKVHGEFAVQRAWDMLGPRKMAFRSPVMANPKAQQLARQPLPPPKPTDGSRMALACELAKSADQGVGFGKSPPGSINTSSIRPFIQVGSEHDKGQQSPSRPPMHTPIPRGHSCSSQVAEDDAALLRFQPHGKLRETVRRTGVQPLLSDPEIEADNEEDTDGGLQNIESQASHLDTILIFNPAQTLHNRSSTMNTPPSLLPKPQALGTPESFSHFRLFEGSLFQGRSCPPISPPAITQKSYGHETPIQTRWKRVQELRTQQVSRVKTGGVSEDQEGEGRKAGFRYNDNTVDPAVLRSFTKGRGAGLEFREVQREDEILLCPNVARVMKCALPVETVITSEATDAMQKCVSEFISNITKAAARKCNQESRKAMNGHDVLFSVNSLGFGHSAQAPFQVSPTGCIPPSQALGSGISRRTTPSQPGGYGFQATNNSPTLMPEWLSHRTSQLRHYTDDTVYLDNQLTETFGAPYQASLTERIPPPQTIESSIPMESIFSPTNWQVSQPNSLEIDGLITDFATIPRGLTDNSPTDTYFEVRSFNGSNNDWDTTFFATYGGSHPDAQGATFNTAQALQNRSNSSHSGGTFGSYEAIMQVEPPNSGTSSGSSSFGLAQMSPADVQMGMVCSSPFPIGSSISSHEYKWGGETSVEVGEQGCQGVDHLPTVSGWSSEMSMGPLNPQANSRSPSSLPVDSPAGSSQGRHAQYGVSPAHTAAIATTAALSRVYPPLPSEGDEQNERTDKKPLLRRKAHVSPSASIPMKRQRSGSDVRGGCNGEGIGGVEEDLVGVEELVLRWTTLTREALDGLGVRDWR